MCSCAHAFGQIDRFAAQQLKVTVLLGSICTKLLHLTCHMYFILHVCIAVAVCMMPPGGGAASAASPSARTRAVAHASTKHAMHMIEVHA